jgi:hypothetical protein
MNYQTTKVPDLVSCALPCPRRAGRGSWLVQVSKQSWHVGVVINILSLLSASHCDCVLVSHVSDHGSRELNSNSPYHF